jgi:hypothetical protein
MNVQGHELRLFEDAIAGNGFLSFEANEITRILYVVHGSIGIADQTYADDAAWYGCGAAEVHAALSGATIWRFELARASQSSNVLAPEHGQTRAKMLAPLAGPSAGEMLMRCDSVAFSPGGCAFLHRHQGPGIRCLIEGGIRIDCDGRSFSYGPGGAWFESGSEPVFAQAAADRPTRFLRVMILPRELRGQSSISYVRPEDRDKPKSQRYKQYIDSPIDPREHG